MKIITLTLNPATDLHIECDTLTLGAYNTAVGAESIPAGKGLNLSRALAAWGTPVTAYLALGSESRDEYLGATAAHGIDTLYTEREGACRKNINIHANGAETVIATEGIPFTADMAEDMMGKLGGKIDREAFVVLSGSISQGSDKDAIIKALFEFKRHGAEIILDTRSLTTEETVALLPYLIKPNAEETELLTGITPDTDEHAVSAAEALYGMGIKNVMITRGRYRTVFVTDGGTYLITPPEVNVKSTVGAGDSTVAGFLSALYDGENIVTAALRAAAFGSAACMTRGTNPPKKEDIISLIPKVRLEKVK